jgi:hypothetical protein
LPFRLLTQEPTIIFNIAYWLTYAMAGFFMYLLVLDLSRSHVIGVAAGIFYAFSPFRLDNITHLQYAQHQWLPLALLFLLRFFNTKKLRYAIFAALAGWATALSSGSFMLMAIVPVGLFALFLWGMKPLSLKDIGKLVLAAAILVITVFPFYYQSLQVIQENRVIVPFERFLKFSPDVLDFAKQPKYHTMTFYEVLPDQIRTPYFSMFPGWILSILGVVAVVLFLLPRTGDRADSDSVAVPWLQITQNVLRFSILGLIIITAITLVILALNPGKPTLSFTWTSLLFWLLLLSTAAYSGFSVMQFRRGIIRLQAALLRIFLFLVVVGVMLSLGPYIHINNVPSGSNVYMAFFALVPGVDRVRQVMQYHTYTMLFLVPAAGLVLARLRTLDKKWFSAILMILLALVAFEYQTDVSKDYAEVPTDPPAMYKWLEKEPPETPIVELPLWPYPHHPESDRVYWSMYHWKPMLNGFHSYFPDDYYQLIEKMADFPSRNSIEFLQTYYDIKYAIVRLRHYDAEQMNTLVSLLDKPWSSFKLLKKWEYFWVLENVNYNPATFYEVQPPPLLSDIKVQR